MDTLIDFRQPDAPNGIRWAGFHQDFFIRAEQVGLQRFILAKLCQIATHNNVKPVLRPNFVIKALHLSAQCLRDTGMGCSQNLRQRRLVTKKPCLLRHHKMFGGRIGDAVNDKGGREPLAQTPLTVGLITLGLVALKEEVFGLSTGRDLSDEFIDGQ